METLIIVFFIAGFVSGYTHSQVKHRTATDYFAERDRKTIKLLNPKVRQICQENQNGNQKRN